MAVLSAELKVIKAASLIDFKMKIAYEGLKLFLYSLNWYNYFSNHKLPLMKV